LGACWHGWEFEMEPEKLIKAPFGHVMSGVEDLEARREKFDTDADNQLVTSLTALDSPQDEPGGRSAGLGFAQGDRRAPSTLAAGDESPMNSRERRVQRAF
jgi:hypothetical protein